MAVRLGQENGYTFTAEDVKAFINLKSQEANPELSAQELEAVAGGKSQSDASTPCPVSTKVTFCALVTSCWGSVC